MLFINPLHLNGFAKLLRLQSIQHRHYPVSCRCLGRFVGDPASLARDNILVPWDSAEHDDGPTDHSDYLSLKKKKKIDEKIYILVIDK